MRLLRLAETPPRLPPPRRGGCSPCEASVEKVGVRLAACRCVKAQTDAAGRQLPRAPLLNELNHLGR